MSSVTELWAKSGETFETKSLSQILKFAGDGVLKDGNQTSQEFRELLAQVPSRFLKSFANHCLEEKFDDGGFALQDVINQIGTRLDFNVEHGLYRGKHSAIGYDGIWRTRDNYSIVVEVKTTDVYRLPLDPLAEYRNKLIDQNKIDKSKSSILIVVGRQDTGELEAQIRGSKHAWDIRLLSTDSLINLLSLKETLNDTKTIQQITELLKPREYTRIDELIEIIFLTSRDLKIVEEEVQQEVEDKKKEKSDEPKFTPVNFHEECLIKIQEKLGINFIKQSRVSFTNKDRTVGLVCAISKAHAQGKNYKYWFAFHPHQEDFLKQFSKAYISYGCGSPRNTFLIPFQVFQPLVKNFWTTETDGRIYWHVVIHERDKKFYL